MEGTPKAIEMKGIVRNATKIGVQDGQAEDLINLRFMDGSWRASGNGRQIENMPTGTIYQQLYVHTNIYHHLLGVDNGVLYWFAEIDNDGVTFYPLDATSDRSQWPEDKQDLPTEPVALTTVTGSMWITQTGHLLTIIDEADDFEHFVFKTDNKKYIEVNVEVNDKSTERNIFPFGQVHFNWYSKRPELLFKTMVSSTFYDDLFTEKDFDIRNHKYLSLKQWENPFDFDTFKNLLKTIQGELRSQNKFSGALLVCAAIRLYDGSYIYASNPVLINPRQQAFDKNIWFQKNNDSSYTIKTFSQAPDYDSYVSQYFPYNGHTIDEDGFIKSIRHARREGQGNIILTPRIYQYSCLTAKFVGVDHSVNSEFYDDILPPLVMVWQQDGDSDSVVDKRYIAMLGYDLTFSIDNIDTLFKNKELFTHLCIFVTPDIDTTNINEDDISEYLSKLIPRDTEDVSYELLHSPLFLLKEYAIGELGDLQTNAIVDLSHKEDDGLLEHDNIVNQKQLPVEAFSRTTYLPKVAYNYNNRLHIANYKSYPFFGYPIDLFHLHNHSVKVQNGTWFKDVLPNLADNNDAYLQYQKELVYITNEPDLISAGAPYLLIKTYLSTSQGEQIVCRYIQAYDPSLAQEHTANFIEALNPLLTYPDARAKKMEIYYIEYYNGSNEDTQFGDYIVRKPGLHIRKKEFLLKPHPYLNMAYYIDPDLKPIQFSNFEPLVEPTIQ